MAITTVEQIAALMPDASQLLSDEPEMESSLHWAQLSLLVNTLEWWWRERQDFFIGANLTVYFSREQLRTRDFRGPDFFLVKGTERRPRTSWVVWEEGGKYPDLIIELLSESTAEIDRKLKRELYQDRFRTPEYFWFSPQTLEFEGWELIGGQYQEIKASEGGWRWSQVLGLYLGVIDGKLRYLTAEGEIVPTPEEAAQQSEQRAEEEAMRAEREAQRAEEEAMRAEREAQRAEEEARRAERLAAKLRELGIDPDSL
jgi:Uma2 family endonuclease